MSTQGIVIIVSKKHNKARIATVYFKKFHLLPICAFL